MKQDLRPTIAAVQYELQRRALYLDEIDGDAGPLTWAAIHQALGAPNPVGCAVPSASGGTPLGTADATTENPRKSEESAVEIAPADDRSEKNIAKLIPPAQQAARAFLRAVNNTLRAKFTSDCTVKIISGTRDKDEQNALYDIGRTKPNDEGEWKTVTNARYLYSNHNFGLAFDIGVFGPDGHYYDEHSAYDVAGEIGKSLGLEWGGDWESIQDKPHFELRPDWAAKLSEDDMMVELRRRAARGEAIA